MEKLSRLIITITIQSISSHCLFFWDTNIVSIAAGNHNSGVGKERKKWSFIMATVKPPLMPPLYDGHFFLRTVHTFTLVSTSLQRPLFWRTVHTFTLVSTSLQWLPLFNGHLTFLADSPYIHSCCNLSTMATSLQRPLDFFGGQSIHSLLLQPPYNGHLST